MSIARAILVATLVVTVGGCAIVPIGPPVYVGAHAHGGYGHGHGDGGRYYGGGRGYWRR